MDFAVPDAYSSCSHRTLALVTPSLEQDPWLFNMMGTAISVSFSHGGSGVTLPALFDLC